MTGSREIAPHDVGVVGLRRSYGARVAVDDVGFVAPAGEVTALLGGNGAGKSTTLRLLLGLSRGSGTVSFGGRPLASYAEPQRVVGAFLGAPAFHRSRTARAHLRCLVAGTTISRDRVDEVLDLVGLTDRADAAPRRYSTGMRQRLGVAAALLADPAVLVLDEPVNGLDPHAVISLRDLLAAHAARGGTVLMATHVLAEVEMVATRAVVMDSGSVVSQGRVDDLVTRTASAVPSLRVACDAPDLLATHLATRGGSVTTDGAGGLEVHGLPAVEVAGVAAGLGIRVSELSPRRRSLEDYYVETLATVDAPQLPVSEHS